MSFDREDVRATDPSTNEALIEKYGIVAYASQSNAQSHPERLATIASLYGLSPPEVANCRVLEVGCGDGANLSPMAAGLPDASFVGCDLSPQAIAPGREAIAATGLANVTIHGGPARSIGALLFEAWLADELALHVQPPRLSEVASERPLAGPVTRWQARHGTTLTNLCYEPMKIPDGPARALLALLDGTRTPAELDAAVGAALGVDDPAGRRESIAGYVREFGRLGFLI